MILLVKSPPPLIRIVNTPNTTAATMTVIPTFSCDHFNCFWLGNDPPSSPAGTRNEQVNQAVRTFTPHDFPE